MQRIILQPTGGDTQKDFIDKGFLSWAIKDTPNFRKIWQESIGDTVLFVNKGNIFAIVEINEIEEDIGAYPLRYHWKKNNIKYVDLSIKEFNEVVGYKSNFSPRGYMIAKKDNFDKVFEFLEVYKENTDIKPKPRKDLIDEKDKKVYPRDENEKMHALKEADYKCEFDENHITFTSKETMKNYVEGHHLIPISKHAEFKYDIDVKENIISLCPECHRMLHFAKKEQTRGLLHTLLNNRIERLTKAGLEITIDELVEMY